MKTKNKNQNIKKKKTKTEEQNKRDLVLGMEIRGLTHGAPEEHSLHQEGNWQSINQKKKKRSI